MGAMVSNHIIFCCQSPLEVKSLGSVAIPVKQFIKKHPPKPNLLECEMILFVVGSFLVLSAFEGFKPMNSTKGLETFHFLQSTKRSFLYLLKMAPDSAEKSNYWVGFGIRLSLNAQS